jgi:hypothetical protein
MTKGAFASGIPRLTCRHRLHGNSEHLQAKRTRRFKSRLVLQPRLFSPHAMKRQDNLLARPAHFKFVERYIPRRVSEGLYCTQLLIMGIAGTIAAISVPNPIHGRGRGIFSFIVFCLVAGPIIYAAIRLIKGGRLIPDSSNNKWPIFLRLLSILGFTGAIVFASAHATYYVPAIIGLALSQSAAFGVEVLILQSESN